MKELTELNIALTEARQDVLYNFLAQMTTSLERQGFTFFDVLDGLTNYAYINNKGVDTVCYLSLASSSVRNSPS
jgi:hypothetical protein